MNKLLLGLIVIFFILIFFQSKNEEISTNVSFCFLEEDRFKKMES